MSNQFFHSFMPSPNLCLLLKWEIYINLGWTDCSFLPDRRLPIFKKVWSAEFDFGQYQFFFNWNVAKHSKVAELTTEERQLLNAKITWWSGLSVKTLSWENRIGEWLIFRPLLKIKDLNQNSGNKISFTFKYWLISDLPKLKKLVPINWCTPKLTFYHAEKASAGSIFSILTHQVIYLYLIVDPQTMLLVKLVKITLFVVSHW